MKYIFALIFACISYLGISQDVNQNLSGWPRVLPKALTFSQLFPIGDKDYVRNALVKVKSGSDTSVFFVDRYANWVKLRSTKDGGNGIYGGSGNVPTGGTTATVLGTMTFNALTDAGDRVPFQVKNNTSGEPFIAGFYNSNDSLVIQRLDTEFQIGSSVGLNLYADDILALVGDSINIGTPIASSATEKTFLQVNPSGFLKSQEGVNISQLNNVAGSGEQVAYFVSPTQIATSANLTWKNATGRLGIGTASPGDKLTVSEGKVVSESSTNSSAIVSKLGGGWAGHFLRGYEGSGEAFTLYNDPLIVRLGTYEYSGNKSMRIETGLNRGDSIQISASKFSVRDSDWPYNNVLEAQDGVVDILKNLKTSGLQTEGYAQSASTTTYTISTTKTANLYKPASDQVNLTIVLPASPVDGQLCTLTFYRNVANITYNYGANTFFGGWPASASAGNTFQFRFFTGSGWSYEQ